MRKGDRNQRRSGYALRMTHYAVRIDAPPPFLYNVAGDGNAILHSNFWLPDERRRLGPDGSAFGSGGGGGGGGAGGGGRPAAQHLLGAGEAGAEGLHPPGRVAAAEAREAEPGARRLRLPGAARGGSDASQRAVGGPGGRDGHRRPPPRPGGGGAREGRPGARARAAGPRHPRLDV